MNLHLSTSGQSWSFSNSPIELPRLLERCRTDLLFTEELLSELESPHLAAKIAGSEDFQNETRQQSASRDAEVIRRLTNNIEALSASSSDNEVQIVLQDMHNKLVRCLKLLPAQPRN